MHVCLLACWPRLVPREWFKVTSEIAPQPRRGACGAVSATLGFVIFGGHDSISRDSVPAQLVGSQLFQLRLEAGAGVGQWGVVDVGDSADAPPALAYCSMAAKGDGGIFLSGGINGNLELMHDVFALEFDAAVAKWRWKRLRSPPFAGVEGAVVGQMMHQSAVLKGRLVLFGGYQLLPAERARCVQVCVSSDGPDASMSAI